MEANENLMVGDWLYSIIDRGDHPEKKLCKVTGIRTDSDVPLIQCDDTDVWYPLDSYESIPLTEENLEKNWFIEESKACYGNPLQYCVLADGLWIDILGKNYFEGKLEYIHQLQHALRLCGIEKEIEL